MCKVLTDLHVLGVGVQIKSVSRSFDCAQDDMVLREGVEVCKVLMDLLVLGAEVQVKGASRSFDFAQDDMILGD